MNRRTLFKGLAALLAAAKILPKTELPEAEPAPWLEHEGTTLGHPLKPMDGDYTHIRVNSRGALWVNDSSTQSTDGSSSDPV